MSEASISVSEASICVHMAVFTCITVSKCGEWCECSTSTHDGRCSYLLVGRCCYGPVPPGSCNRTRCCESQVVCVLCVCYAFVYMMEAIVIY